MKGEKVIRAAALAAACALGAACAHQGTRTSAKGTRDATDAARTVTADAEPSSRGDALITVPELKTVHFGYNSDILGASARATLAANAAWLNDHADARVQVTGNCDQRGTVEYNLALGQRRAAAVRSYYALLGVSGSRVSTISYGKERLVCSRNTEACWSQNRRAETLEAVSQNVSSAAPPPAAH